MSVSFQISERKSLTYDELLRQLIDDESQYVRHLNLILKVFMEPFCSDKKIFPPYVSISVKYSGTSLSVFSCSDYADSKLMKINDIHCQFVQH